MMIQKKDSPDLPYDLLNHTADLGIRVYGDSLSNLFKNAGRVLMHLMINGESDEASTPVAMTVSGEDLGDLMVRWLGELHYLLEGDNLVVTSVIIDSIQGFQLKATLGVVPIDPGVHEILNEIKAVTYHQIEVDNKGDHWEARVIFDLSQTVNLLSPPLLPFP